MDGGDEHTLLEPTAATVEAENWNLSFAVVESNLF